MKKIIFLTLMAFAGMQFLAAQEVIQTKKNNPVQWNEKTHDFGTIEQGKPATATFTFKNISDAPIVITNVRSSCGCTVAKYTKEPVRPGEEGEVSATYNAARPGNFNKSVTVTIEGTNNADILIVKGVVKGITANDTKQDTGQ